EPGEILRSYEEETEDEDRPGEVERDHEPSPVHPVRPHPAERRGEEVRQFLGGDRERHRDRLPREVEHQPEQGDQQEPVPTKRDHRREVQPAEVPVAPEQGDGGPKAAQRLDRFARIHVDLQEYWRRTRPKEAEGWGSTGSRGSGRRRSDGRERVRSCTSIRGACRTTCPRTSS